MAKLDGVPEQSFAYLSAFAALPGTVATPMVISQAHDLLLIHLVGMKNGVDLIAPFFQYLNRGFFQQEAQLSAYDPAQGLALIAAVAEGDAFEHTAPALLAVVHAQDPAPVLDGKIMQAETPSTIEAQLGKLLSDQGAKEEKLRQDFTRMHGETRRELAHLGGLVRSQMDNLAPEEYQHARPEPPRQQHRVAFNDQAEPGITAVVDGTRHERSPGRSRPAPGQRPAARNADGSIKPRLMHKPPTLWSEISPSMKATLAMYGIKDQSEWIKREQEFCKLCGPDANHYWSRCVRIWASTSAGERLLGASRAADMIRATQTNVPSTVAAVAHLFDSTGSSDAKECFECVAEGSGAQLLDEPEQPACMLNFIRALCMDQNRLSAQ